MDEIEGGGSGSEETASSDSTVETPDTTSTETASGEVAETGTEGAAESASAAPTQDDEPEGWRKLTAKVGSNLDTAGKQKLADEFFQAKTAASRLSDENKKLQAKLAELERSARSKTTPDEPEEVPPDLQAVESKVKALESERQGLPQRLNKAAADVDAAYKARVKAEVALESADEVDKPGAEARLTRAEIAYDKALAAYENVERRANSIDGEVNAAKREQQGVKKRLEDDRARQAQAEEDREQFNREFPERFDRYIGTAADTAGLHKDPSFRESVRRLSTELSMAAFWYMNQKGVEVTDENESQVASQSLKRLVDFGEAYHRFKLQKVSQDKLKTTTPSVPSKTKTASPPANSGNGRATSDLQKPLQSWRDGPEVIAARERARRAGW